MGKKNIYQQLTLVPLRRGGFGPFFSRPGRSRYTAGSPNIRTRDLRRFEAMKKKKMKKVQCQDSTYQAMPVACRAAGRLAPGLARPHSGPANHKPAGTGRRTSAPPAMSHVVPWPGPRQLFRQPGNWPDLFSGPPWLARISCSSDTLSHTHLLFFPGKWWAVLNIQP